jgi:hypothetical protein
MIQQSQIHRVRSPLQPSRLWLCLSILAALLATAAPSFAADDTARFLGTWSMQFPAAGQMLTLVSIHDSSGYNNYLLIAGSRWPAGNGTFSAANGKYTAAAAKPNDSGTYNFTNNDMIVCTNAAGQTVTWKRYTAALPPLIENGGYNYDVKPALSQVLAAARKNLPDLSFTYVEIQGIPGYLWLQYHLYSPSTGAVVTGYAGGPNSGQYSVTNWKPNDPAQTVLPTNFKVDFADAMRTLQKTGLKPTGLGITRLQWAGATGTPPVLAWSIRVGGTGYLVPLFVDAQTGQVLPWQRAIDPITGNDAQIQAWRDSFKPPPPPQGQSNSGIQAMECVAGLQEGYVGCAP